MNPHKCHICTHKIIKHKPSLICNICNNITHYQCNKLSKSDASYIIETSHNWTCIKCTSELFPLGLLPRPPPARLLTSEPRLHCTACNKLLSSQYSTCTWCDKPCHSRCFKGQLGCTKCASDIIPGFSYSNIALMGTYATHFNDRMYNPYDNPDIQSELHIPDNDTAEATYWHEASDCLIQCTYRQHKTILPTKNFDLKVMSLNIRSLTKHIMEIRDDIDQYSKFDILCFNETSCNPENAPGGLCDFELIGFHPPILQNPARNTNRGGGLAIFINENLCNPDDFHILDNLSSNNSPSHG